MNKYTFLIASIILAAGIIVGAFVITRSSAGVSSSGAAPATHMEGGAQIVEITAKGGYYPSVIAARAGIPTIIRVRTRSTFDCSAAFTIPSLGIRKMLPPSGVSEFPVPAQRAGDELQALCGMGMYSATIQFR